MARISLDIPAPDFTLQDFRGEPVRLSECRGQSHVVLMFNRGFA